MYLNHNGSYGLLNTFNWKGPFTDPVTYADHYKADVDILTSSLFCNSREKLWHELHPCIYFIVLPV